MLRGICRRIGLTCINIFFPPLTVLILTGPGLDTLMNCFLFLLAVLPSHIHGFYISCVYYSRRRKVKKGRYPGTPHSFIYSEKVNNGGLTSDELYDMWFFKSDHEQHSSPRNTPNRASKHVVRSSSRSSSMSSRHDRHRNGLPAAQPSRGGISQVVNGRTRSQRQTQAAPYPGVGSGSLRRQPMTTIRP